MTLLQPAPVSTAQFRYDAAAHLFVGEISSTHGFGRVYDDSLDEGLTLVSKRTGKSVVCVVVHTERDDEGDVLFWRLWPVARPFGPRNDWAIQLFND